jgi:hypothetical protein
MTAELSASRSSQDRMEALEARMSQLSAELNDMGAALTVEAVSANGEDAGTEAAVTPLPAFGSIDDWVEQYFLVVFTRPVGGNIRWCARWRDHAEAVLRLEALWRAWETLRLDPNFGMATWLTNFLDPQMAVLMSSQGTFGNCTLDRHCHE